MKPPVLFFPLTWVAWEPPPKGFSEFGALCNFYITCFTFFTTFAIFAVVLFLPFYGSTLLGACCRLSTYRRHPHLNSVECRGPSLKLWCMSRPWWPPFIFLRSWANGSLISSLITVFSGTRKNVLSIHIFTWQSRANAPLIHSIHASSRH